MLCPIPLEQVRAKSQENTSTVQRSYTVYTVTSTDYYHLRPNQLNYCNNIQWTRTTSSRRTDKHKLHEIPTKSWEI